MPEAMTFIAVRAPVLRGVGNILFSMRLCSRTEGDANCSLFSIAELRFFMKPPPTRGSRYGAALNVTRLQTVRLADVKRRQ
jgi:hypothetical protein